MVGEVGREQQAAVFAAPTDGNECGLAADQIAQGLARLALARVAVSRPHLVRCFHGLRPFWASADAVLATRQSGPRARCAAAPLPWLGPAAAERRGHRLVPPERGPLCSEYRGASAIPGPVRLAVPAAPSGLPWIELPVHCSCFVLIMHCAGFV